MNRKLRTARRNKQYEKTIRNLLIFADEITNNVNASDAELRFAYRILKHLDKFREKVFKGLT